MTTYCVSPFTHAPMFLRTLLYAGVDTMMLDNEHQVIPEAELREALSILEGKARAIVRPEKTSVEMVEKYWAMGARSILLPKVEDIEELAMIAARVGELAGDELDDYSIIPLLETQESLEKIEAIAAIPEIRSINIGPFDLASEMGLKDFRTNVAFVDLLETYVRRIAKAGCAAGLYVLPEWIDRFRATPLEHYSFGAYELIGAYLRDLKQAA